MPAPRRGPPCARAPWRCALPGRSGCTVGAPADHRADAASRRCPDCACGSPAPCIRGRHAVGRGNRSVAGGLGAAVGRRGTRRRAEFRPPLRRAVDSGTSGCRPAR